MGNTPRRTYGDLFDGESLVLILTRAPLNGGDEALPDALNEFGVRKWTLPLFRLDGGNNLYIQGSIVPD